MLSKVLFQNPGNQPKSCSTLFTLCENSKLCVILICLPPSSSLQHHVALEICALATQVAETIRVVVTIPCSPEPTWASTKAALRGAAPESCAGTSPKSCNVRCSQTQSAFCAKNPLLMGHLLKTINGDYLLSRLPEGTTPNMLERRNLGRR